MTYETDMNCHMTCITDTDSHSKIYEQHNSTQLQGSAIDSLYDKSCIRNAEEIDKLVWYEHACVSKCPAMTMTLNLSLQAVTQKLEYFLILQDTKWGVVRTPNVAIKLYLVTLIFQ